MRFLLGSDSPTTPTGMSNQMRHIARFISKEGHEIFYIGWQNIIQERFKDGNIEYDVFPGLLPTGAPEDLFGKKFYPLYYEKFKPDVLITLGDAWMVDQIPQYTYNPLWIMYFPVDGHPLNKNMIDTITRAHFPVAMSKFGRAVCRSHGIEVHYIPHQINYKKISSYSKPKKVKAARKKYFPELKDDTVLFGSIARNNPRKHHVRLLRAFEIFVRKNGLTPDDVRLYLHLDPKDVMIHIKVNGHDYLFLEWVDTLGLNDFVIYPPITGGVAKGLPEDELYSRMSVIDVHVNATGGEGFGVPTLEVMALGIPNVITDYTTSKELITHKDMRSEEELPNFLDHRGILVPYKRLYMENSDVYKAWVDVDAMADAFTMYYTNKDLRKRHGDNAKKFSKQYDSKVVNAMWKELLDSIPEVEVIMR